MSEQQQQQEPSAPQLSEETQRLAELGRNGDTAPAIDPLHPPKAGVKERPSDVPEKFWDADKGEVRTDALLKSYAELEKHRGQPAAEPSTPEKQAAPVEDEPAPEGDEAEPAAGDGTQAPAFADAVQSAKDEYAAKGALSDDSRKALIDAGIPAETLDNYLEGVKALERALEAEVFSLAGNEDDYRAAVAWAAEAWSAEEIAAFDGAIGNPALRTNSVKGLMAAYREANPGEGRLTTTAGAIDHGDVYATKEEFLKDLQEATDKGDLVARQKAVRKLERSRKAGTVKEVTPRSGPFRG